MKNLAIFGNHTEAGKTVISAILVKALNAAYWKPVQAGSEGQTDRKQVLEWVKEAKALPEAYLLQHAGSPHYAAKLEGIQIKSENLIPLENGMIIETCGGALSPLTDTILQADIVSRWNAEVILVIRHYIGGISHALMTIEALLKRQCALRGIIFNGAPYPEAEKLILQHAQAPMLARLLPEKSINAEVISAYASEWKKIL